MTADYRDRAKAAILDERFVRATLSGQAPGPGPVVPWVKVVLRPVLVKGRRRLQVESFDARRSITKNYAAQDVPAQLGVLLAYAFAHIHVDTATESLQVRVTKGGKALVSVGAPSTASRQPAADLAHNRKKKMALPASQPDPFLQAVGIMTREGVVKADKQRKFRQINEFLAVIDGTLRHAATDDVLGRGRAETAGSVGIPPAETGTGGTPTLPGFSHANDDVEAEGRPISVVDCGCGSAYLTFATYHYVRHVRNMPTRLVGIDVNAELLAAHEAKVRELGWTGLTFETTPIADFTPATPPDMVVALHACDTATDDALAQAIRWRSGLILCVPCCQHHLQRQLDQRRAMAPFRPILRHGVLRERLGDIVTDAFRALILRIMGYQTDVMEFVSAEHTAKNVMIRAVRATRPGDPAFAQEYNELKAVWQVTPYLEEVLGEELAAYLHC